MTDQKQEETIEQCLLESFICLLSKIRYAQPDDMCKQKVSKLKPALQTQAKKKKLEDQIREVLDPVYQKYRTEIIDKDFGFVEEANIVLLDINLSEVFPRIFEADDAAREKEAINEILYLFYQIMSPEDRKETEQRHQKKKTKKLKKFTDKPTPKPDTSQITSSIPDPSNLIQQLLAENAPHLKEAERDPSKMGDAIRKVISSGKVASMVENMVKNLQKADTLK